MNLKEFIVHYVKAKDAYYKTLVGFKEEEGKINFNFKTGSVPYFISEELEKIQLEKLKQYPKKFMICNNTLKNVEYLIKNWKDFAVQEGLIIMFANPSINEKWLINTAMHAKVTEEKDIKAGLMGLFNNVPPVI